MADVNLAFAPDDDSNIIYREKRKYINANLVMNTNQRIVCSNVPFELFDGAYIALKATGVDAANATINIYRTVFPKQPVLADDLAQFIPIPGATAIFPINVGAGLDFQIQNFYGDRIMIELVSGGANAGILNDIYIVGKKRGLKMANLGVDVPSDNSSSSAAILAALLAIQALLTGSARDPELILAIIDGNTPANAQSMSLEYNGAGGTFDGVAVADGTVLNFTPGNQNDTLAQKPFTVPPAGSILIAYTV